MEGFKRLFDGKHPVKKLLRGIGMSGVNKMNALKQPIIAQAMGLSGDLPRRAKAD